MNKDLTVGRAESVVFRFCIPLFGSILFQQLYNIADSFVAGKFVGEDALAAVGNSYEITLIFLAFAFGCNIGCSVISSQLFGAGRYRDLKTAIYTSLISSGVVCAALMVCGAVFGGRLLTLINTPDEVFEASKLYLDIYILGLPFVFYYNIATGIFSALGNSKTPFIFLMCSSLSNIAVDILFTTKLSFIFTRGVDGVAWATFLCQGVSCILSLVFVFKSLKTVRTDKRSPVFDLRIFGRICGIAIPSILQQSFISIGNIIIQGVINTFMTGVMAGYSASVKLNNLVITSLTTVGNGISNFTAQNIGAGKNKRVKEGFIAGLKLVWAICIPIAILYFFAGRFFVYIFLDSPSESALSAGIEFLKIVSPFYLIISIKLIADGVLRGAGKMKLFMISTFTDLLLRVGLAKILSATALGSTGIWLAWPLGWIISTVLSFIFYRSGKWGEAKTRSEDGGQISEDRI